MSPTSAYGHPDFEPKLVGRAINLMISPLPRNKRGKNPRQEEAELHQADEADEAEPAPERAHHSKPHALKESEKVKVVVAEQPPAAAGGFNNPFVKLEIK